MTAHHVDRAVVRVARRQHGTFTRHQAKEAGATDGMISDRVAAGSWVWLTHSVYAVAAAQATWHRSLKAAELSIPGAAISDTTAACPHRLPRFQPGGIHLVVPPGRSARSPLAVVHRSCVTAVTTVDGIRVTTLAHTLFDIAGRVSFERLEQALDHALLERRLPLRELAGRYEVLGRRRRGMGAMRALLEERTDGFVPPASGLERALYRLLEAPGLPSFIRQAHLPSASTIWPAPRRAHPRVAPDRGS